MSAFETWGGLNPHNDRIWKEFEEQFVPATGMADTVAGEIVRAMDRLIYRFFNDDDMVGVGYGNVTCNSSDRFLSKVVPPYVSLDGSTLRSKKAYEDQLRTNHRTTFAYLMNMGQFTFMEPNHFDSRIANDEDREREREDYEDENYEDENYED